MQVIKNKSLLSGISFLMLITFLFVFCNRRREMPLRVTMEFDGVEGDALSIPAGANGDIKINFYVESNVRKDDFEQMEVWQDAAVFMAFPSVGSSDDTVRAEALVSGKARIEVRPTPLILPSPYGAIASPHPLCAIKIVNGVLKKGDKISVRIYENNPYGRRLMVIPRSIGHRQIKVYGKKENKKTTLIANPLSVNVIGGEAHFVRFYAPSVVMAGEPFDVLVRVEDIHHNPAGSYNGTLLLEADNLLNFPAKITFSDGEALKWVKGVVAGSEGVVRISAMEESGRVYVFSNPIKIYKELPPWRIFWGDLHCHAYDGHELSVFQRFSDPRELYRIARYEQGLNFLAVTPHVFVEHSELPRKWWHYLREGYKATDDGGVFVPFLGYEWRGMGGDHNVVFPEDYKGLKDPANGDVQKMYQMADESGAVVIPHVGGVTADLAYHDERVQRMVEITSNHGRNEWLGHEALMRGYHIGFVGGSDSHSSGCGGDIISALNQPYSDDFNFRTASYHGGLTAVYASSLNRKDIFQALKERRTYSTTGARILLDFRVNDNFMGSIAESEETPEISLEVYGEKELASVEVVRDDIVVFSKHDVGSDYRTTFKDDTAEVGKHFYYLRVTQVDEEVAWSSPIQVKVKSAVVRNKKKELIRWNEDDTSFKDYPQDDRAKALEHELSDILNRIDAGRLVASLKFLKIIESIEGEYAVFLSHDEKEKCNVRIEYFIDRKYKVLRMTKGWRSYGQYSNRKLVTKR